MKFIPAPGHVEIRPIKNEGLAPISEEKYEEMGEVVAIPHDKADSFAEYHHNIRVGDTIFFDSYACRATPEVNGEKHYVVSLDGGGYLGVIHKDVEEKPL